jgi:hypothetical protein
MENFTRAVRNFLLDGTKALSFISPTLSILFLVGKAWEWPVMEALKDFSYAWAFVPLLALAMVAYVRRWNYSRSLESNRDLQAAVDILSDYFEDGNRRLFNANISNADEFIQWAQDWSAWARQVEDHIENSFSRAERNNFRNRVLLEIRHIPGSFDKIHNHQRCILEEELEKIREITVRHSTIGKPFNAQR